MFERLSEAEQLERYASVHKRLYFPPRPIEALPKPEPKPDPKPEPEPLWVGLLKEDALDATLEANYSKRIFIGDCIKAVCTYYNISRRDMLSSRRQRFITRPRQVSMYLSKMLTDGSMPEIGRRHGNRDHTTVLHACRRIEHLLDSDLVLRADIVRIKRRIARAA